MEEPVPTGAHGVEVANSYARRSGDDVLLHVHLPRADALQQPTLRLKRVGKGQPRTFDGDVSVASMAKGVLLTTTVPASEVSPGLWQLQLRDAEGEEFRRVRARLLVDPKMPVALLSGPVPETRMAAPRPRNRATAGRSAAARYANRLRRVAGRAARRLKPSR
jgi:hypothetical protein